MSKKKFVAFTLLTLVWLSVFPQIPGKLRFDRFGKAHDYGIPGVYDMFQDQLGVLWLGSTNGIYRYNGTEILEFKGDDRKILGKTNYSFLQEDNGDVLIGSDYGLCRYRLKENRVELLLHFDRPFDERSKYCVIGYDRQKRLWLSISGVGVAYYRDGKTEFLKDTGNITGRKPDRMRPGYIDLKNDLLYLPSYLVSSAIVDLKTLSVKPSPDPYMSGIKKIGERLFIFYPDKIVTRTESGKQTVYPFPEDYRKKTGALYAKVTVRDDSCLWLSGMNGIISFNYQKNQFAECFGFENDTRSQPLKLISELFTDRLGNTWICSETDGMLLFNSSLQNRFQFADGARDLTVMDVEAVNDSLVLVCPLVGAPCLINLRTNTRISLFDEGITWAETMKTDRLNDSMCVLSASSSSAWLFNCRSLRMTKTQTSDPLAGFAKLIVTRPNEGYLLSYSRIHKFRFAQGVFQLTAGSQVGGAFNFTLLHDSFNKVLIFSTRENSLVIDDSSLQIVKTTAPIFGAFNGYRQTPDGHLWLATRQGLKHYARNYKLLETFNTDNGLNNDVIYELLFNRDSTRFFLSTNRGISELHITSGKIKNYTTDDGIQESEHNTGACAKGNNGRFYFGNIHGLTFFTEQGLRVTATKPFLVMKSVLVNDTAYQKQMHPQFIDAVILHPGDNQFSVRYSLFQSSEQKAVVYSYQLEGYDRGRQNSTTPPVINYQGLDPGDYTLKLSGCVEGQCIEKQIRVTVIPPYYRTWWFVLISSIAGVIMFVFLASLIAKARVRRKEKKLETERRVLEEKTRISRDLHDNVGARLSMMLNTMDWITKTRTFDESTITELQDNTRSVIQNLRETIWVMNREEITAVELFDKIKNYALQFFRYHNTKINFDERITEDRTFNSEQTLNLFRITQEALNNTLKYAGASSIDITIITHPEAHLEINFSDNGVGFNMENYEAGNGILNMRERAEEINAGFFIDSAPGKGTLIRIELYSK